MAGIGVPAALGLPSVIGSADVEHLDLEELFDGFFDLNLIGALIDLEGIGVVVFLEDGSLLRHPDGIDDAVNISHGLLSGLGGALGEGFEGVINDDDGVEEEEFLDIDILGGLKKRPGEIALGPIGFLSEGTTDDENLL